MNLLESAISRLDLTDPSPQEAILTPHSHDLVYVQACIAKERKRLAMVEGEVSALTEHGEEIQRDRTEIKERISRLLQQLVLLIPVEILVKIFGMAIGIPECLDALFDKHPDDNPDCRVYELKKGGDYEETTPQKEPWFIASVCRVWREVMLTNPSLWSQIRIGELTCFRRFVDIEDGIRWVPLDDAEWISQMVDALRMHLDRSGSHDIFLTTVGNHVHTSREHKESLAPFFDILSQHSHRIRYMYLPHTLADAIRGPFPRLHSLDFKIAPHRLDSDDIHCSFQGNATPEHARICFRSRAILPRQFLDLTSWESLSTLILHGTVETPVPILTILLTAVNLVHLDIHIQVRGHVTLIGDEHEWRKVAFGSTIGITLPKLERLAVHRANEKCMAYILQLLITPALEHLRIGGGPHSKASYSMYILRLIDQSRCAISSLSISLYDEDTDPLVALIQNPLVAKSLRRLSITTKGAHPEDHTIFSRFLSPVGPAEDQPCLETVMCCGITAEETELILDTLEQSALGEDGNGLKTVMLRGCRDGEFCQQVEKPGIMLDRIGEIRKSGLDIQVRHRCGDDSWPEADVKDDFYFNRPFHT